MTEKLVIPQSDDEVAAYIARYFDEYDELSRQMSAGERTDPGPIPSQLIFDLIDQDRYGDAWTLMALLIDAAPSEDALAFVAAADLEHLICLRRPPDVFYHEIIDRAHENVQLRTALGLMYWNGAPDWFLAEAKALGVSTY